MIRDHHGTSRIRLPQYVADEKPAPDGHPLVYEVRRVPGVPSALDQARQILAISNKRTEERLINHLTREEMKTILDAPNPNTRSGIRDQAMLYLGLAAGLRASELVGLRLDDIELEGPYRIFWSGERLKADVVFRCGRGCAGTSRLAGSVKWFNRCDQPS